MYAVTSRVMCQVLYKDRVLKVTSSAVEGSSVCSYNNCYTRIECLQLHQVLYKVWVFTFTSSVVEWYFALT